MQPWRKDGEVPSVPVPPRPATLFGNLRSPAFHTRKTFQNNHFKRDLFLFAYEILFKKCHRQKIQAAHYVVAE